MQTLPLVTVIFGKGLTVTEQIAFEKQPLTLVPVILYVVFTVG